MSDVYLQHHGIKGQKWGVRRFQNADGSLTSAGKKRRGDGENNGRVTIRQANKIALAARKESIANDRAKSKSGERVTVRQANNNARKAAELAVKDTKSAKAQVKIEKTTRRVQTKQYGQLEDSYIYKKNVKEKDLMKAYGRLEDSIKYSKYGNKKANVYIEKALGELDKQLSQTGKKATYDVKKVNDLIEKAMVSIDEDLNKK